MLRKRAENSNIDMNYPYSFNKSHYFTNIAFMTNLEISQSSQVCVRVQYHSA